VADGESILHRKAWLVALLGSTMHSSILLYSMRFSMMVVMHRMGAIYGDGDFGTDDSKNGFYLLLLMVPTDRDDETRVRDRRDRWYCTLEGE